MARFRKKSVCLFSVLGIIGLVASFLSSCNKKEIERANTIVQDTVTAPDSVVLEDGISDQFDSFIVALSVENPPLSEILGPDGEPLQETNSVKGILHDMLKYAHDLAEEKKSVKHEMEPSSEYYISPEHWGYAYSYGQRNITQRLPPTQGNSIHKKYRTYGTDCSGLIINLFSRVGIELDRNTTNVRVFESNLKAAIKKTEKKIIVQNLENLPIDAILPGDLIRWYVPEDDINHMGIIYEKNNIKYVYQSNGTYNPKTTAIQLQNLDKNHGVHPFSLSGMIANGWGPKYNILRLKTIGDTAYGGVIFYIDDTREHGLVCTPENLPMGMWDKNCVKSNGQYAPVITGAQSTEIGTGRANTQIIYPIVSGAALQCFILYGVGGYYDWFLPSKDELNELCKQFHHIPKLSAGIYWSSSENENEIIVTNPDGSTFAQSIQQAWAQEFPSGRYPAADEPKVGWGTKNRTYNIRPVRKF